MTHAVNENTTKENAEKKAQLSSFYMTTSILLFMTIVWLGCAILLTHSNESNMKREALQLKNKRLESISSMQGQVQKKAVLTALTENKIFPCLSSQEINIDHDNIEAKETECFIKILNTVIIDNPNGGIALAKAAIDAGYALPDSYRYMTEGNLDPVALASVVLN